MRKLLSWFRAFGSKQFSRFLEFIICSQHFEVMPAKPLQLAKRVLVSLLLELAGAFSLTVDINRDSPDKVLKTTYRKVMLKVHPDKPGGSVEAAKRFCRRARKCSFYNMELMPAVSRSVLNARSARVKA